ncbi:MAG: calcium-binding protein [Acidimicrobiales bacterium]
MGKSGKAAAVVGLSALVGGVGLFSSPVFGDVGDDIGIRVGLATADFDGSGLIVTPTGFKSCSATVIDPNDAGQSFRISVPADCLDGYLISGSGYGGAGEVPVVTDSPFEVIVAPGEVRDLEPNPDLTSLANSRIVGNVNVFNAASYACGAVLLEAASIGGTFAGSPTGCVPVEVCAGAPLAECYAPEIRFHPDEQFFPMRPADFIAGSELRWASDSGCRDDTVSNHPSEFGMGNLLYEAFEHKGQFELPWNVCDPIDERTYLTNVYTRPFKPQPGNGERATRADDVSFLASKEGFYLEWNSGDANRGTEPFDTVPVSVKPQLFVTELTEPAEGVKPGERWLVYQVFYGHDPKSLTHAGDNAFGHQGDWERVDVVLDAGNVPLRVQFHGHGCDAFEINWPDNSDPAGGPVLFDRPANAALSFSGAGSTHPVVYIAEGTHASYAEPFEAVGVLGSGQPNSTCSSGFSGKTDATGDGGTAWRTWEGPLVDPSTQCWYQYGGAWGTTGALVGFRSDTTGPDGPPWKMRGDALSGPGDACFNHSVHVDPVVGSVSADWGTQYVMDVVAPSGTTVLAYLASVPVPLGEFTVDAGGNTQVDVVIPVGTPPGMHRLILIDAATGLEFFVKRISVDGPVECLSEPAPGVADIDGDFVIDECDDNPFDGPLADADFDLVLNDVDNCPLTPNPGQERIAERSVGIACDFREGVNPAPTIIAPELYPLPPAVLDDEAVVEAGESIEIDVLGNDIDPDGDTDETSLIITQQGSLGVATVIDDGEGGRLVSYLGGIAGGVDTVGYKVCDDTQRCATGVIVVTVIGSSDCTITGTSGPDNLTGTDGPDIICGRGGADVINGLAGDDIILGGRGADTINGGAGDDRISGGRGNDSIEGGDGADTLNGNRGQDVLHGGNGNDTVRGGKHSDTLFGDAGDDLMFGGRGADEIRGGDGADLIRGRQGPDVLRGNDGDDTIYGGRAGDEIRGGAGNDTLYGRSGNDHLIGGNGDDLLFGNRGDDVLEGRSGVDEADGGRGSDSCFAETSRRCE